MEKVGRNDPCPCGSGKKYKKCHGANEGSGGQTFMESLGMPNAATAVIKELEAGMDGMSFESAAEARRFMESFQIERNRAPITDFLGLSSEDMHLILHDPARAVPRLLDFKGALKEEDVPIIPLLRQALYLLRALARGPLRLTKAGYLDPDFVSEWYDAAFDLTESPGFRDIVRPRKESDGYPLFRTRDICERRGLVRAGSRRLELEPKGSALAAGGDFLGLYRELFVGELEQSGDEGFGYNDRFPPLAGQAVLFALFVLGKLPRKPLGDDEIIAPFARAFPSAGDFSEQPDRRVYLSIAFERPTQELGLARERPLLSRDIEEERSLELGPLYDRILSWRRQGPQSP